MNEQHDAMTEDLRDTLVRRAERADERPLDLDDVLAAVHELTERRARQRRGAAAGGAGALLVAAAVTILLALAPGTGPSATRSAVVPAGGGAAPSTGLTWSPKQTLNPSQPALAARSAAARALEASRAAASRAAAARLAASGHTLVEIAPAPAAAELSIGLAPKGWTYLGAPSIGALYGVRGAVDSSLDGFEGKLALLVSERYDKRTSFPLTIAGHPGLIGSDGAGGWGVTVIVSTKVEVDIQVPKSAHLTKAQVLRLADTLTIRSTKRMGHG